MWPYVTSALSAAQQNSVLVCLYNAALIIILSPPQMHQISHLKLHQLIPFVNTHCSYNLMMHGVKPPGFPGKRKFPTI